MIASLNMMAEMQIKYYSTLESRCRSQHWSRVAECVFTVLHAFTIQCSACIHNFIHNSLLYRHSPCKPMHIFTIYMYCFICIHHLTVLHVCTSPAFIMHCCDCFQHYCCARIHQSLFCMHSMIALCTSIIYYFSCIHPVHSCGCFHH